MGRNALNGIQHVLRKVTLRKIKDEASVHFSPKFDSVALQLHSAQNYITIGSATPVLLTQAALEVVQLKL